MEKPNYLFVSFVFQGPKGQGHGARFMSYTGCLNLMGIAQRIEDDDEKYDSVIITFYDRLTEEEFQSSIESK